MAPTYTNMDHLTSQLQQQQIDLTSSISETIIQFVDEFQYDEQLNHQEQHGIPGITSGYYMGRQSVTDAVTNPLFQC